MVYISSDGKILNSVPWGFKRIADVFSAAIFMVIMFFKTLFGMEADKNDGRNARDSRPGFGPPKPSSRKLGRPSNVNHSVDVPFGCSTCQM